MNARGQKQKISSSFQLANPFARKQGAVMGKRLILILATFTFSVSLLAQSNPPASVVTITNYVTVPVSNSLNLNPADAVNAIVDVLPSKYQKAALALIALLLIGGRTYAALVATGKLPAPTKLASVWKSVVLGVSQQQQNDIDAAKAALKLPPVPLPPQVVSPTPPKP